ncbi:SMI1/KNR4 family protein [Streptomyces minutiscleroticus]|uniref:SMI1/KNR4 family protein n=1 Tax=Streptomyces minutiscleroticus TaxID=68238 RepID=UPI003327837F
MADSWRRIDSWLAAHVPRTLASLRPGASQEATRAAAAELGVEFPADLVASLRQHDGALLGEGSFTFPGYEPLSLASLVKDDRMRREVWGRHGEEMPFEGYWHHQYVTLARSGRTDALVLDCREGESFGAVGVHIKGEGTEFGQWPGLAALLQGLADCLEHGSVLELDGRHVPIVEQEMLLWERVHEPRPAPRSVLDLAAAVPPPAVTSPHDTSGDAAAEDMWASGYDAFCLVFVHAVDEGELLRRYGALPATRRRRSRQQAHAEARTDMTQNRAGLFPVVRVGVRGEWAFGIEEGHRQGVRSEVLRRVSHGTRAVAVGFFHGTTTMSYFDHGELVTVYDTGRAFRLDGERDPFEIVPGLPPHDESALRHRGGGFLLPPGPERPTPAQQRTKLREVRDAVFLHFGIDLPPDALTGELDSAHLLPVLPDGRRPVPVPNTLSSLVDAAPPVRLRRVLAAQTASLAAETGLDGYGEIADVLPQVGQEAGPDFTDDSGLGLRLRRTVAEAEAARGPLRDAEGRPLIDHQEVLAWQDRAEAALALADALTRPPQESLGWILHLRQDPHWRQEVRRQLTDDSPAPDRTSRSSH